MSDRKRYLVHISLFLVTCATTTLAGAEWIWGRYLWSDPAITWQDVEDGLNFSVPFLLVLTVHEFGHYFTARYHQIQVSLPYYIPLWFGFIPYWPSLGTMGAFIRIRQTIFSRLQYFDIGISGPLAGFVVAVGFIYYGFQNLPPTSYIYEVHPSYELFGEDFEKVLATTDTVIYKRQVNPDRRNYISMPDSLVYPARGALHFGDNLLFMYARSHWAPADRYVPGPDELMHYPYLLAGFLALFFTSLNLLPIGQLDGGHITFGLFGPKGHEVISSVLFTLFVFYAGLGFVSVHDLNSGQLDETWFAVLVLFYLYLIYLSAYSLIEDPRNRWVFAAVVLTLQIMVNAFFHWKGYSGWLLFAILLGRVVGIQHPPVTDYHSLPLGRKILGWIALIVFLVSFSPQPLVIDL